MSDNYQEKALALCESGLGVAEIVRHIYGGITGKTYQDAYDKIRGFLRRRGLLEKPIIVSETVDEPEIIEQERLEYKANGDIVSERLIQIMTENDKTPEQLLILHGFDPKVFEFVSGTSNMWTIKGNTLDKTNYQSKIIVRKRKLQEISYDEIAKQFDELDRRYVSTIPKIVKRDATYMPLVNIVDMHLSKLCWHGDTPENYDSKIARQIWERMVSEIYSELVPHKDNIEKVMFNWANDFFNVDNEQKTTTKGTRQDVDVRTQKMFNIGCEMLVVAIDTLLKIAPVHTFWTLSNHDETHGYHALCFLKAWYRNDPNVTIDIDAYPRKYYTYGQTLLGFSHGNEENNKNMAMLMPIEAKHEWASTEYKEFIMAHLHSEHAWEERNGIIFRRTSSPTATDAWHARAGYVGAVRKAQTLVYEKKKGLKYIINTVV